MSTEKIKRIQEIARYLQMLESNQKALFAELNAFPNDLVTELIEEYRNVEEQFQPINLLRYEVLNQLQEERPPLTATDVDWYRECIKRKDTEYFQKYGTKVIEGLANYQKRDPFNAFQRQGQTLYFRLLYTFFYRRHESRLVNQSLREISHELATELDLTNYRIHAVDFRGSTNFGAIQCWLALYPAPFNSLRQSHSLFIAILPQGLRAGLWSGAENKASFEGSVEYFNTYETAIVFLQRLKTDYYRLNQQVKEEPYTITEKSISVEETVIPYPSASYTKKDALHELFLDEAAFDELLSALHYKQNLIIQGPPGVGKSFVARRLAYTLLGSKDSSRLATVQFHQSYSYEDFMQGLRPDGQGGFRLQNGLFYTFCQQARNNIQRPYVFLIEEINRGNLSRILGELFQLLESDKRNPEAAITLTYSGERFFLPPNLYLIGTMNTADRSLALVDYALRRRFSFVDLSPAFGEKFQSFLLTHQLSIEFIHNLVRKIEDINKVIHNDRHLGSGFQIGQSYFTQPELPEKSWFERIIRLEIAPLLREYWFDQPEYAEDQIRALLA
ncbi:MAG: AAA family ATPase [Siphonobacter sp.]